LLYKYYFTVYFGALYKDRRFQGKSTSKRIPQLPATNNVQQCQQESQRLILTNIVSMMMLHGQERRMFEQHTKVIYVTTKVTLQQKRKLGL
jgi:hypothetical protein